MLSYEQARRAGFSYIFGVLNGQEIRTDFVQVGARLPRCSLDAALSSPDGEKWRSGVSGRMRVRRALARWRHLPQDAFIHTHTPSALTHTSMCVSHMHARLRTQEVSAALPKKDTPIVIMCDSKYANMETAKGRDFGIRSRGLQACYYLLKVGSPVLFSMLPRGAGREAHARAPHVRCIGGQGAGGTPLSLSSRRTAE